MNRSLLRTILYCHAMTCNWEVKGLFVERDRHQQTIWRRRIRCSRCGSWRIDRVPPGRPDDLLGRSYDRIEGWSDVPEYYGAAWARLQREGFLDLEPMAA